ncbi:hypothetical protein, partial [Gluconobacter japonicus]|uniref:hypothetical protein n=2 Tax=Gluconobacter japonicus TaxID=376620 RepID=UPI0035E6ADA1
MVQQDVAKFYSDQSSYGLSAYPTIAYSVALNIGMNGITANANMQAGVKSGDSVNVVTEKMMVYLARADMNTINSNSGAPASIAQITQFHIDTYQALNVDPVHWSGYEPALQNGTWIPNATSEDLRDVTTQSQYIKDQSIGAQTEAIADLMDAGLIGAQTALGQYLYHSQGGTPLVSNFSQFWSDLGIGTQVGERAILSAGTYLVKGGGELLVSQ